ncbi:MAG: phosphoenolpyruvate carboxykinase (ATP) [Actinobacteria bacterium HGW-Actinobacteria-10]|jgi:phosphoenolpyruvate carboxykinase (ATP)|nr:MAG: phosphoenolpyruvate carboxykinase (ATP) [Actinobacteria bacterium HGW-Actinobacteria-10]
MTDDVVRAQLSELGLTTNRGIYRNLPPAELIARSLARNEGILAANGALVVKTGEPSGRSPRDRVIVNEGTASELICWGDVNMPCEPALFDRLLDKARGYLHDRDLYVFDGFSGAERTYRLPIRVVADATWHALFANTLFVRPTQTELDDIVPEFTVINCGALRASSDFDGTRSSVFIGVSFTRKIVLILGSMYGGEMKKAVFSVMNYLLPQRDVLPMHCSANMGEAGDVALFFGLSGTGKTTLSADPARRLIGDDEHGWSDHSVFNFEGGCYAKTISLSAESEPQIFGAIRFGSILENVIIDPQTRAIDYDSDFLTENTRATYPIDHIPNAVLGGVGDHPRNVFFLTCDAFGVLPPISRLTPEMASYHFLSGFTSKVAGTEVGIDEPRPTFSSCFGEPFMPLHATRYAEMLAERLARHETDCWLLNTGWTGGGYGTGHRMSIDTTRALISAALDGSLASAEFTPHPVFKVLVPASCRGVPDQVLDPRATWDDGEAYDRTAQELADMFAVNFEQFAPHVSEDVLAAAPAVTSDTAA